VSCPQAVPRSCQAASFAHSMREAPHDVYLTPRQPPPFAVVGDEYSNPLPSRYAEKHTYSQISLGGPDQVRPEDIRREAILVQAKNPYAGRSQASSISFAQNEELAPPQAGGRVHRGGRAAQSTIELTDRMPDGAGRLPPPGFFFNAHGNLQAEPAHAKIAARSHISNAIFGGAPDAGGPPPDAQEHIKGRARVDSAKAGGSIVDAIVFGHQRGSATDAAACLAAKAAAEPRDGRKHVRGRDSLITDSLMWDHAEAVQPPMQLLAPGEPYWAQAQYPAQPLADQQHRVASFDFQPRSFQPPPSFDDPPHAVDYTRAGGVPRTSTIPTYELPASQVPGSVSRLDPTGGGGGQGAPLLYDQEQRRWVSRDGIPTKHDPILRSGHGHGHVQDAPRGPSGGGGGGGFRHPKLWLSTAQAAYPQPTIPPPGAAMGMDDRGRLSSQFTRNFAPPAPGGGFVF